MNFVSLCENLSTNVVINPHLPTVGGGITKPLADDLQVLVKKKNAMGKHPRGHIWWILAERSLVEHTEDDAFIQSDFFYFFLPE